MLKFWRAKAEAWLYPAHCVLCGEAGAAGKELCHACLAELPYNTPCCGRCALPLAVATPAGTLCGQCQQAPPPYDSSFSLFHYAYPVDQLIQQLKFNAKLNVARLLGELMATRLQDKCRHAPPEIIIPVPLHTVRLRERGFNQALELARPIANRLGISVDAHSCIRTRPTAVQSLLAAKDRRANTRGAFKIIKPIDARHIAIVDDVMTTGHTLQEFAGVLRKAGARTIEVWTCARASLHT